MKLIAEQMVSIEGRIVKPPAEFDAPKDVAESLIAAGAARKKSEAKPEDVGRLELQKKIEDEMRIREQQAEAEARNAFEAEPPIEHHDATIENLEETATEPEDEETNRKKVENEMREKVEALGKEAANEDRSEVHPIDPDLDPVSGRRVRRMVKTSPDAKG